jgi:hypothetical protein
LHARGDFLGEKFDQKIWHDGHRNDDRR